MYLSTYSRTTPSGGFDRKTFSQPCGIRLINIIHCDFKFPIIIEGFWGGSRLSSDTSGRQSKTKLPQFTLKRISPCLWWGNNQGWFSQWGINNTVYPNVHHNNRPWPIKYIVLKFLPNMLSKKCSIICSYYFKYASKFIIFLRLDCLIIKVYSLLCTDCLIRMFHKMTVLLEYFDVFLSHIVIVYLLCSHYAWCFYVLKVMLA